MESALIIHQVEREFSTDHQHKIMDEKQYNGRYSLFYTLKSYILIDVRETKANLTLKRMEIAKN